LSACVPTQYGRDLSFEEAPEREWTTGTYANFEGALIHRRVVEKIGYPDARFFVAGDDMIYGYLASFHTNVLFAREVGFRRVLPLPARSTRMSCYLSVRNRFLTREHLQHRGAPVDDKAFWIALLRAALWLIRDAARGFPSGWRNNVRAVVRGVIDGKRGKYGRPPWIPA
jgi:rhamnopyranosyl-N-acetylglucosaminyl-diphospho-decaprenol beta-1,3/1,4-galactofuranosyltransferase